MRKFVFALLILLVGVSFTGCSKNSAEDKKKLEDVKALVTKLQTFKGNASPDNVDALYKDIEPILSPDLQKYFEDVNIPNAKKGVPSHFIGNEIEEPKSYSDMDYYGVKCKGYVVYSTYKWKEDTSGKEVAFKSHTEIVEYDGNLIVTYDSDLPVN